MSKKKALGQDPFSIEIFPWIKNTETDDESRSIQMQIREELPKQRLQGQLSKQELPSLPKTLRQTYHLSLDNIEKVKRYAYIERLKISEVVNRALFEFFKNNKPAE